MISAFSDQSFDWNVPSRGLQTSDSLEFIPDTDELGSTPETRIAKVRQASIIEAGTAA
jgi:hypothetical protein